MNLRVNLLLGTHAPFHNIAMQTLVPCIVFGSGKPNPPKKLDIIPEGTEYNISEISKSSVWEKCVSSLGSNLQVLIEGMAHCFWIMKLFPYKDYI